MKRAGAARSEADVLEAFAIEAEHNREMLERYLRAYPEHASALCQLSFELTRTDSEERELGEDDELLVAKAWSDRVVTDGQDVNPLQALSGPEKRRVAEGLGVKLQVLTLFREGRIMVSSVPLSVLKDFARLLGSKVEALERGLSVPALSQARTYKADGKPSAEQQISFERALRDSGASDDDIARLTGDH